MTGIRTAIGWGKLTRAAGQKNDEMPTATPTPMECLPLLTNRFGGAVTFSSTETRNTALQNDLGLREPTTATQGLTQGSFSISGYFAAQMADWLALAYHTDAIQVTTASTFAAKDTSVITPTATTLGYITTAGTTSKIAVTYGTFESYQASATAGLTVYIYGYAHLGTAKSFDLGQFQINSTTDNGGNNLAAVFCGCYIDTFSLSYENGGDAAVQFQIDGYYLKKYTQVTSQLYDYANVIEDPPANVLITGCMLKSDDSSTFTQVAFTDSSSISVANNLQPVPACGQITYGTYALANVSYDVQTSTYSNDPNKYISYLYGYSSYALNSTGTTTVSPVYEPQKQPYCIPYLRIRSQDTVYGTNPTQFLDVNLDNTYIGSMDFSYDVGSLIMDTPSLMTKHAYIAVAYTASP